MLDPPRFAFFIYCSKLSKSSDDTKLKRLYHTINACIAFCVIVILLFPATEITEYFEIEMKKLGFIKSPTAIIGMFKWKDFNQRTGEWEETKKVPARYRATWVDPDKNMRIWLNLKYKKDSTNENWEETLYVSCNIAKYFE